MPGDSDKKKKTAEPAAPSVATNPNYIPMQQPAAFAPGMQNMLASQLASGFGSPGLLGSSSQDFNGLLNSIYAPATPEQAADPIGAALNAANSKNLEGQMASQARIPDPNKGLDGEVNAARAQRDMYGGHR